MQNCTYKQIKKEVLSRLNKFLKDAKQIFHRSGFRLDFSSEHSKLFTTVVFSEHGLIKMIKTFEYECIEQISFFLRATTDRMWGDECEPDITELFTSYVELLRYVRRENTSSSWSETDLANLRRISVTFKGVGKSVFGVFQPSSMRTQKWHLLNHSVDYIKHVGGKQLLYRGLYESWHEIFQTVYAKNQGDKDQQWTMLYADIMRNFSMRIILVE